MSDDNEGMRLVRGKKPKYAGSPRTLDQVAPGAVVLVALRVGAHLAGPGHGPRTTALCRMFAAPNREELYVCGDLIVARADLVPVYPERED